ncbi:hypothetical protein FPY71_10035 [Aureimonas fodinaquatilis]|uniref:Cyanophage baseplate Pam3 plug gp18 domain-containing protein n=1 Tax=Aureimonas fodinaquatilis TaxID=2565783 RepID=A0A5B0DY52_9HYPH|nr:hypothetical protein [Aureimonas fodinaquatilis]KAA0970805.1 hypothetical protein FPY71_10035 [Aureimonas fodinaquatilis]
MREFVVTNDADQQFTVVLNGRRCTIRIRYNVTAERWMMDLSIDDTPVLTGRRLVVGSDLLAAYDFGLGSIFLLSETGETNPGRDELPGGMVRMYHATPAEIAAVVG